MKRKLIIIASSICLVISIFLIGYFNYISTPEVMENKASLDLYAEDLSVIELNSELIVKAKIKGIQDNYVEYNDLKIPSYGYTLTDIEVQKVYKGEDKLKNCVLKLREPSYYYKNDLGKKFIINSEGYTPLKQGETYVLFLSKSYMKDTYYCTGLYQGKFILKDKNSEDKILNSLDKVSADDIDISETILNGNYKKLYKEVIDKYKD